MPRPRPCASGAPPEAAAPFGNVKATRDDWLDLALSVLAAEGVAHVTVLNLSERLGVSRSSFYWYFKNCDELARRPARPLGPPQYALDREPSG